MHLNSRLLDSVRKESLDALDKIFETQRQQSEQKNEKRGSSNVNIERQSSTRWIR